MYKISGILFCILTGFLVGIYGWTAIIWMMLGTAAALFSSANIILPLLMGIPLAIPLVKKKLIRPRIFLAIFRTPIIWLTPIIIIGLIFPKAVEWISKNDTLEIGLLFGIVNILCSPFSKKTRADYREDFDKSYARYYTNHTDFKLDHTDIYNKKVQEQIQALIKIASNMYLNQVSYSFDTLNFEFSDSKFRCLILCLTTVIKVCEELLDDKESTEKESLHFISYVGTTKENCLEYFNEIVDAKQAEKNAIIYYSNFMTNWTKYYELIQSGKETDATKTLCLMIHSTENNKELSLSDAERLIPLSREIEASFYSMRKAFTSIMSETK